MDSNMILLIALISLFGVILVCIYCMKLFDRRQRPSFEDLQFVSTDFHVLRENLVDTVMEDGKAEWQCVVCAHVNHPSKQRCLLCGAVEVLVGARTKTLNSSILLSSTRSVRDISLSITEHEEKNFARQRALVYRRNNMQLTQRQRQAKRRRLWQRVHLPSGQFVWLRTSPIKLQSSSSNVGNGSGNNSMIDSFVKKIRNSSFLMPNCKELPTTMTEMLHRKNAASMGYVSHVNESGALVWRHANAEPMNLEGIDELMCLEDGHHVDMEGLLALPFQEKKKWFLKKISRLSVPITESWHNIVVRRDHILEDSVSVMNIKKHQAYKLRQHLHVTFSGEPGLDAGGLLREWFHLLCLELFNPILGLFRRNDNENASYGINPDSGVHLKNTHLQYFNFAGHVFGKSILEGVVLNVHLMVPLLKHILGVPISFSDLEFLDEELYKHFLYLRDNEGVENLYLTFSVCNQNGEIVDLKPNGRHIDVTDYNKQEYLSQILEYYMLRSIQDQLQAFLSGLHEVIPKALLNIFDYQELELFICGIPEVDPKDWEKYSHIRYIKEVPQSTQNQVVKWYWEVVSQFNMEERARLLQFVSGSSRVPVEGFKGLTSSSGYVHQFTIQLVPRGLPPAGMCPRAHTCFNRVDFPLYQDKEELENYLSLVIQMEITGFGLE